MAGITVKQVGSMARKSNPLTRVKVKSPPQRPKGSTAAPSKRLVKRRKATQRAPEGYYANPKPRAVFFGVKVNAGNDRNGNSRRGVFVFETIDDVEARPVGFVAEDFGGRRSILDTYGNIPVVGEFDISPAQYTAAKKQGPEWITGAMAKSRAAY